MQNQFGTVNEIDDDLKWLKNLLLVYQSKPENIDFKNFFQKALFSNYQNFVVIDNLIYFKQQKCTPISYLYVLPETAVKEVLRLGHSSIFGGHLGTKKTFSKILSRFFRPHLKASIIDYVKNCDICQRTKNTQPIRKGELKYLTPKLPNEIVTMDIAGPFTTSKDGNMYILFLICAFTKFSKAVALKKNTAENLTVILINDWICVFGVPEFILSDRGANFQSMLLELLNEKFDIKQLRTTAYHPECDGQSERFVRTIKSMLRCYVYANQLNWDENLAKLSFAYNTSVHATTRFTPHEMIFGQKPRIPLDLVFKKVSKFRILVRT
ncbi:unnamed protein product [Brachionus calyciflorus]|uniref:Integrase catalytic domain-containing protein n=1 Tax=Brachionus calyciflorus TaxID=104777 RepID=A0A814JJN1_9BILA|nr:unnamed protein product [Brachionus calyciflorus]